MRQRLSKSTNSILEKLKRRNPVPNGGTSFSPTAKGTDVSLPSTSPASAPQSVQSQSVSNAAVSIVRTDGDVWALAFKMAQEREGKLMLAYEEYLSSLQSDNAASGDLSIPDFITSIVNRAIEEREKKKWRFSLLGTSIEVRAQAERLTKFLLWSDPIIKATVSNQPYAALAWSGVSLLLPLVTSGTTQNEAMLKGFNSIGDLQMYWRICENTGSPSIYDSSPQPFIESLGKLYSFFIEYQARVICHLAKSQLSRAWSDITSPGEWDEKIQEIHQLNNKCRDILHLVNANQIERNWKEQLLEMQESRIFLDKIYNTLLESGIENQKNYEERTERELLQTLASDYQGYKDFNPQKVKGTCEWFFADERFRNWRDSNASSLLWVSAGPGCGKSVLSRALIDERRLSTNVTTSTVCYFFFKDGDEGRMYAHNALCAVIHQLFTQDSTGKLIAQALAAHKSFGEKLAQSFSELWEILIRCSNSLKFGEIICVIDALDECNVDSRKSFIEKLKEFYRRPSELLRSKLKFLITSRPYDDIEVSFKYLSGVAGYLRFDGDDKSGDIGDEINLVIDDRVNEIAEDFKEEDRRLISDKLKSMEHRTYLWLHLTLDIIKKSPSEYGRRIDVEVLLSSLPTEVSEAYEKILDKSKRQDYTEALLQILLAATRPLTLDEANFALTVATKEQGFDSHAALENDLWPSNKFKDDVKNLCGLFVTVHDGKLSFIHQTAREFLTHAKQGGNWKGKFNNEPKLHSRVSLICIRYLLLLDVATVSIQRQNDSPYRFLLYAANSWALHYASQEATDTYLYRKDALTLCCIDHVWKDIVYVPRRDFSGLEWASYFGLQQIVQDILLEKADARHNLEAALKLASEKGHKEIVQMLLESGAAINAKRIYYGEETALHIASEKGHKEIVQMLLENGINVNATTYSRKTALNIASEKGKRRYGQHQKNGYKEIVQMLLENGADINEKGDYYGKTALHIASENGYKEIVQILLENGADVNERGGAVGDTALFAASERDYKEIVQMLLENGADVHTKRGIDGMMVLGVASRFGHKEIVQMLLESGADINEKRSHYRDTALHGASEKGHKEIVQMLQEWEAK
ncbi:hypothetical protein TrVGV298_000600 [Trichoderma virens]|nr:hypothetical protein TrVGV298_000600 [Trichoderma virens]